VTQAYQAVATAETAANRAEFAAEAASSPPRTSLYFSNKAFVDLLTRPTEGPWVIVVAACDTLQSAQARANELASEDYPSAIYLVTNQFLVTIGQFTSYIESAEALVSVRSDINDLAYVLDPSNVCFEATSTDDGYYECVSSWQLP
jgi:hypothetical protein